MTDQYRKLRENVLMIHAGCKQRTGLTDNPQQFDTIAPYTNKTLFTRILRELWFRLKLPFRSIWYNKEVLEYTGKHLLVFDPQIKIGIQLVGMGIVRLTGLDAGFLCDAVGMNLLQLLNFFLRGNHTGKSVMAAQRIAAAEGDGLDIFRFRDIAGDADGV